MVGASLAIMKLICPGRCFPALQGQAGEANFLETVFSMVRASKRDTEPVKSKAGTATSRLIAAAVMIRIVSRTRGLISHDDPM